MQLCRAGDDPPESRRVEGGAADKCAIDVRLGEDLASVVRRHASAIENRHLIGSHSIELAQVITNLGRSRLSVIACRGVSGPDRPDRLVGDRQAASGNPVQVCEADSELDVDDGLGRARRALLEVLPDGQDRA